MYVYRYLNSSAEKKQFCNVWRWRSMRTIIIFPIPLQAQKALVSTEIADTAPTRLTSLTLWLFVFGCFMLIDHLYSPKWSRIHTKKEKNIAITIQC